MSSTPQPPHPHTHTLEHDVNKKNSLSTLQRAFFLCVLPWFVFFLSFKSLSKDQKQNMRLHCMKPVI